VTQQDVQAPAPQRTGVAMAVIMTGVLMTAVDTTIVVLALPEIRRQHVSARRPGRRVHLRPARRVLPSMGFMALAAALAAALSALRARRS
jgi:hypothetical protein